VLRGAQVLRTTYGTRASTRLKAEVNSMVQLGELLSFGGMRSVESCYAKKY